MHHRLLTADEVLRMVEAGILREEERVELIEGELIEMTPINPPHGGVVARLFPRWFMRWASRRSSGRRAPCA